MNRKQAREQAFILVFESAFQPESSMDEIISTYTEILEESASDEVRLFPINSFSKDLALGTERKQADIDGIIGQYAIGWKVNRIPKVSLSLLRMALYEMLYAKDTPIGVTINEAVELSKKYATKEDAVFINGLLGKVAREQQTAETEETAK